LWLSPHCKLKFKSKNLKLNNYKKAAEKTFDCGVQTLWRYPKNATTQYEARELDDNQKQKILETPDLNTFLKDSINL
jgi:hypothetical protein